MKAILVDDEPLALEIFEIMLQKIPNIEVIATYTNPFLMMEEIGELEVDVLFLDMEMGIVHGLDVSKELDDKYPHVAIVFVTAHPQFALEAFDVNAIDYLVKPVSLNRLQQTIMKLKRNKVNYAEKNDLFEVSIQVMGHFKLFDASNNEVRWRTKKAKELLAILWLHRENPLSRYQIIEELWPDIDQDRAATNMHTTVYQLRRTLKNIGFNNAVSLVNDYYIIDLPVTSDLEQLDLIFQKEQTPDTINQAIQLYQDGYLTGEDYRWSTPKKFEIQKKFATYLEKFCSLHPVSEKRSTLYEKSLLTLTTLDRYSEDYMRKLLTYYAETNHITNFLENFQNYERMLKEDLGIDLPPSILYLYNTYINKEKRSAD